MNQKQNKAVLFFLLVTTVFYAQMQKYDAKIELKNITDTWHNIVLPDTVFANTQDHLSDIRIYGISPKNDTIEAPYLFNYTSPELKTKTVEYKLLNASTKDGIYYFTLKVPSKDPINHIKLDFENTNFDWKVSVEASHHQKKWFKIYDDYRIVAIKNNLTNYSFTDINFSAAEYTYFRIGIKSDEEPILKRATLELKQKTTANITDRKLKSYNINEDKKNKKTIINVNLTKKAPTHQVTINVSDDIDYYRPIKIEELLDSVKTDKGYLYDYNTLSVGTLSSIENNTFTFDNTFSKKIRITILNFDNQPLKIKNISAKGYKYLLTARFTEPATYYLTYGNKDAYGPSYDIAQLNIKMPKNIKKLSLGEPVFIAKKEKQTQEPLFNNKLWLWVIMVLIMTIIGWFSYKMLSNKPEENK